jgi:hypothetical protein
MPVFSQETPGGLIALSDHFHKREGITQASLPFPYCIFISPVAKAIREW